MLNIKVEQPRTAEPLIFTIGCIHCVGTTIKKCKYCGRKPTDTEIKRNLEWKKELNDTLKIL